MGYVQHGRNRDALGADLFAKVREIATRAGTTDTSSVLPTAVAKIFNAPSLIAPAPAPAPAPATTGIRIMAPTTANIDPVPTTAPILTASTPSAPAPTGGIAPPTSFTPPTSPTPETAPILDGGTTNPAAPPPGPGGDIPTATAGGGVSPITPGTGIRFTGGDDPLDPFTGPEVYNPDGSPVTAKASVMSFGDTLKNLPPIAKVGGAILLAVLFGTGRR